MKKYKLLKDQSITINGKRLYRIKALRAFGNVNKGDIGGYVEKEDNLSHNGNAWVYNDAKVFGNAKVYDNAWVSGDAWVYDDAKVYGNAWVHGNTEVYGSASVYGNAWVSGNTKVYDDALVYGNARVFGETLVFGNAKVFGTTELGNKIYKLEPSKCCDMDDEDEDENNTISYTPKYKVGDILCSDDYKDIGSVKYIEVAILPNDISIKYYCGPEQDYTELRFIEGYDKFS